MNEETTTLVGWVSPTPTPSKMGAVVADRYEVLGLVGVGGMASVYRVRDRKLDEIVALKVMSPQLVEKQQMRDRFRQEVKLARRVTHPNVVRTYDIGEYESTIFLTMEYVPAEPLTRLIRQGPLSATTIRRVFIQACAGVSAAHEAGVFHRDLKPDNILVSDDRTVITDFGIARAVGGLVQTLPGLVGTPHYMSPEQVRGEPIDGRSDVYALGAILFEALTGRLAWEGSTPYTIAFARLTNPPPDPTAICDSIDPRWGPIVARAMAVDADQRFPTAAALAEALQAGDAGTPTPPPRVAPRPDPKAQKVAVLPFRFHGPEDESWMASGFTEELIDTLSMTDGLLVRPFRAIENLVDDRRTPREIGDELGVDVVVEGSLRCFGARLRLNARVIQVDNGFQLWAKRFDGDPSDLLTASDAAASAIAIALTTEVKGPDRKVSSEAVSLYLQGRAALRQGWTTRVDRAVEILERARAIAPDDAKILSALALARGRQAFVTNADIDHRRAILLAQEACDRAIANAPELGEPWLALATIRMNSLDVVGAVGALRTALERSPGLAQAQELLGTLLVEGGHRDEGLEWLESAVDIDPTPTAVVVLARTHLLHGKPTGARELIEQHSRSGINLFALARSRFNAWYPDHFDPLPQMPPSATYEARSMDFMFREIQATGKITPAVAELLGDPPVRLTPRLSILHKQFVAEGYALAGLHEEAMFALLQSVERGLTDLEWMDLCPLLEPIRDAPEWEDLRDVVAERNRGMVG